ncbi:MAG: cyclic nucleotide-binding domain-containing protein [Verrucomicrobiae bacterium]|nr:cyclic nucleotide-binding domain-containing protein [Verrucomicrobiae bacterium]
MRIELTASRFCRNLSAEDVALIRSEGTRRRFPADAEVFHEGDPGDGLYIILAGAVDIVTRLPSGQNYVLSRMDAGDYFGEMAVFDGEPRSATALVREELDTVFVSLDLVQRVVERTPLAGAMLVRDASLRLREFNQRFLQESLRSERLSLVERLVRSFVHDFRNPLNVIGIAAEMAAVESATPAARRQARDRMQKQIGILNRMMQELVDFTRGAPVATVLPKVSYADFLRDMLLDLETGAAQRGVQVAVEGTLPAVRLRLDGARFARVFHNLAQNAFEALAASPAPVVTLRFQSTPTHVLTEFSDNGPGIPPENLPHVFEPFFTHGKDHGTGLGLAICDRIVQDHGGRITVRSDPGQGATFLILLPLPKPGDTDHLEREDGARGGDGSGPVENAA